MNTPRGAHAGRREWSSGLRARPVHAKRLPVNMRMIAAMMRRVLPGVLIVIGAALIGLAFVIGCWPLAEQEVDRRRHESMGQAFVADNTPQQASDVEELMAAYEYNERLLASGQPVMGETIDPFSGALSGDFSGENDNDYIHQLDDDGGVMAVIEIPDIRVTLPVRHGSDAATLDRGAGHLHGSSLPVGGGGTHCVITAHRGLSDKPMFTRLDEMDIGDRFMIYVEGERLAYRVDRIDTVEPDYVEGLRAISGEDRVTLMTCTPYGINTHRLLVSGVRDTTYEQSLVGGMSTGGQNEWRLKEREESNGGHASSGLPDDVLMSVGAACIVASAGIGVIAIRARRRANGLLRNGGTPRHRRCTPSLI